MLKRKYTFVLPGKAIARLVHESSGLVYFDYMRVTKAYRKNGICTEFVRFAAEYFRRWPELDIRYQSTVAQRVATNLGYDKVKRSDRYKGCGLWLAAKPNNQLPQSRLVIKRSTAFVAKDHLTEVLYLGFKKYTEPSEMMLPNPSAAPDANRATRGRRTVSS